MRPAKRCGGRGATRPIRSEYFTLRITLRSCLSSPRATARGRARAADATCGRCSVGRQRHAPGPPAERPTLQRAESCTPATTPGGAEVWDSGRIGSPRGSGALNEGIDGYPMIATMRRPAEARSAGRAQAQRGSRAAGDTAGDAGSLASRRGTISLVHRSETPGAPVSTHPFRRCVPPSSPQPLADSPVRALALVAVRAFALAMHALAMCGGGCARLIACRARLVAATGSAAIALALGTVAGRPSMRGRLSWRTVPSLAALALARLAFALRVELGAPLARLAAALARARRRWCPSDRRVRVAARGG